MPNKENFLRNEFVQLLAGIDPATAPHWGKMNVHQVIEHMSDSFRNANGKDVETCLAPAEQVEKMQAFLMSDKPFRENTPNPKMPDTPAPVRFRDINDSLHELQTEINDFFNTFAAQPDKVLTNPFFGDLSFNMWVQLLYKHAVHHLKQFGVVAATA